MNSRPQTRSSAARLTPVPPMAAAVIVRAASLMLMAAVLIGLTLAAAPAQAEDGPNAEERALEQTLSADEQIAQGRTVIRQGHVDMGPKMVDGRWQLMLRDDQAEPVWRYPSDVVFAVSEEARLPKPDDPRYEFVDAAAGHEVYVVPQTEAEGIVWPGWSTQDPAVQEVLGTGAHLTLEGVEGPGQMTLYLENGDFSAPQLLWDSSVEREQDIWVPTNTHTHANWVFTEPGAYAVTVRAHATLRDGTEVSDTEKLLFAVGSATAPEQAFALADRQEGDAASAEAADSTGSPRDSEAEHSAAADASQDSGAVSPAGASEDHTPILLFAGAGVLLALALLLIWVSWRSRRARRESELTEQSDVAAGHGPGAAGGEARREDSRPEEPRPEQPREGEDR